MSRNNVRGPTSALTEFLRDSGITPTTIARRAATRAQPQAAEQNEEQPVAGPSRAPDAESSARSGRPRRRPTRSLWTNGSSKPPVGSFENCAVCGKQFTVTKYTMASSGNDPFKKPAVPKKRKAPADKRSITNFEERRFPTLVSLCIQLITRHIDDIDAFGDIGTMNVEAIAKALSKNRSFPANSTLTFYDATNLASPALETLVYHNANLVSLRLDFCGHLDDNSFKVFSTSLPALERIELLGPFLVRPPAWQNFFKSHPGLTGFLINQSPRFDEDCVKSLVNNCPQITNLRLKQVGQMQGSFLLHIATLKQGLQYLDISEPSQSCSEASMIKLLRAVGKTLTHLDVSKHADLTDGFLKKGLIPFTGALQSLVLSYLPELTDQGLSDFFNGWTSNSALFSLDVSRNEVMGSAALEGILKHSGSKLEELNINGWKDVGEESLKMIGQATQQLKKVDVGFCRAVDDFVIQEWLEGKLKRGHRTDGCSKLEEVKLWGCNRITVSCPRKKGVSILGVESHTLR
ncbi:hypothetical protein CPB84DRAFT_1939292 [Gymnopilus junonius]|uniref:DNA repair protein rhp7 treble clef domain-containing protein n=1 Tax=Gymnopilus junonius TaxID=109634 RepID=A0A9P5NLL2_GYMJU|nr:hypothetical protein CPB84DRAFT_1939292 [Gymnopilus junonius]